MFPLNSSKISAYLSIFLSASEFHFFDFLAPATIVHFFVHYINRKLFLHLPTVTFVITVTVTNRGNHCHGHVRVMLGSQSRYETWSVTDETTVTIAIIFAVVQLPPKSVLQKWLTVWKLVQPWPDQSDKVLQPCSLLLVSRFRTPGIPVYYGCVEGGTLGDFLHVRVQLLCDITHTNVFWIGIASKHTQLSWNRYLLTLSVCIEEHNPVQKTAWRLLEARGDDSAGVCREPGTSVTETLLHREAFLCWPYIKALEKLHKLKDSLRDK